MKKFLLISALVLATCFGYSAQFTEDTITSHVDVHLSRDGASDYKAVISATTVTSNGTVVRSITRDLYPTLTGPQQTTVQNVITAAVNKLKADESLN